MTDQPPKSDPQTDDFDTVPGPPPLRTGAVKASPRRTAASEHLDVPDDLSEEVPPAPFATSDYGPVIFGSGAAKLADSAVAPIVALARGYETVTRETVRDAASKFGLGAMNSAHGKQLLGNVGEHDALMMPWYSPEDVFQAQRRRDEGAEPALGTPRFNSLQVRPHELSGRVNKEGKRLKYDIFSGFNSVLGVHPATPASWLREAPVLFLTEGAIKGDSALTGLLRHNGVDEADLRLHEGESAYDAIVRLNALMTAVPEDQRVLIVTFVGVGNWHRNPDWNSFRIKGHKVWVAFDGDVSSNNNVWLQASQLWEFLKKKSGTPCLLDLMVPSEGLGENEFAKIGVDDYLSKVGTWASLVRRVSPDLPARPVLEEEYAPGDWRVNDKDKRCEELVEEPGDFGGADTRTRWVPRTMFSARISAIETARYVRDTEMESGRLEDSLDGGEVNSTEVLFEWNKTAPGDPGQAIVRGPGTMMADPPDQWHRRGAKVPPTLANHPDWPPSKKEWARAVKRHRRDDIVDRAVWNQMGWVPTSEDGMVFIAGEDVVGAHGTTDTALPGVGEHVLAGAGKFGLNPPDDDDEARAAIRAMLDAYLSSPWNDRRVAALVIATGLRPVCPLDPRAPILITGPRRRGKTWTAEAMLAFWQRTPGAFADMPGQASDTRYSIENAVARVPIWVADDLAPSGDRRKSDTQQATIGEIVRAMFNGTGKRRMNSDGSTREVLKPRAVFVVTAENALSVSSEMDRLVHIATGDKFLNTTVHTARVEAMTTNTVTQSRVTAACIQTIAIDAARRGWDKTRRFWVEALTMARDEARHAMAGGMDTAKVGEASRHAKIASDLAMGLLALMETCSRLEMEEEYEIVSNLRDDLYSLVSDCFSAQKNTTPGAALVQALRSVLASGQGHLVAPGQAGPPVQASSIYGSEAAWVNQRLGWPIPSDADDSPRPTGQTIGYVVAARDGSLHAVFEPKSAFALAQRNYADLLIFGMKADATWGSVWSEELASTQWKRKHGGSGLTSTVRVSGVQGVPIPIDTLLGVAGEHSEDDEDDEEADDDTSASEVSPEPPQIIEAAT